MQDSGVKLQVTVCQCDSVGTTPVNTFLRCLSQIKCTISYLVTVLLRLDNDEWKRGIYTLPEADCFFYDLLNYVSLTGNILGNHTTKSGDCTGCYLYLCIRT